MQRLIVADAHVGQRPGDAGEMAGMVRRLPEHGFTELIYLGDAFQYLIGRAKFWTSPVQQVMAAWQEVRSHGIRIVLIEGNRDFFLDEDELVRSVDWTGRCYEFEAGGRRYRLLHGDRLNLRDLQYQFWSRISKSWPARLLAGLLPRALAVRIVRGTEARLAVTNQRFRGQIPEPALRRNAARAWSDGIHVMLWGHFHRSWQCSDGDRIGMVVPAWLDCSQSLAVAADGSWRWVERSLTPATTLPTIDRSTAPEPSDLR